MAPSSYRDSNGVTWTVITAENGFTLIGSVLDEADPKYDPEPPDLTASMAQGGLQIGDLDIIKSDPPTGEQQRVLFIELVKKIEAWAKSHKGPQVSLRVTATAPVAVPWWVWVVGAMVLAKRR
jgi:hypothetical protein